MSPFDRFIEIFTDPRSTYEQKRDAAVNFGDWTSLLNNAGWAAAFATSAATVYAKAAENSWEAFWCLPVMAFFGVLAFILGVVASLVAGEAFTQGNYGWWRYIASIIFFVVYGSVLTGLVYVVDGLLA